MKILITTDGSKNSLAAIEAFVARIGWFAARPAVELVNVHPAIPYGGAAAWAGKEAVEKYYAEECEAALKPGSALLAKHQISFVASRLVGDPASEIVRHAKSSQCDLIVMGTHGHTAMGNLVMGSVATKVLAASTVPVLLMK